MKEKRLDLSDVAGGYLVIDRSVFPLPTKRTTIGRHTDNDCIVNDPTISRKHAEITFENDVFVISDLGSTGGTYVNNKRIEKSVLNSGDIILLGRYPMMFMYEDPGMIQQHNEEETGSFK